MLCDLLRACHNGPGGAVTLAHAGLVAVEAMARVCKNLVRSSWRTIQLENKERRTQRLSADRFVLCVVTFLNIVLNPHTERGAHYWRQEIRTTVLEVCDCWRIQLESSTMCVVEDSG